VDTLLAGGHDVAAVDDLSTGHRRFLEAAEQSPRFDLVQLDLLEPGDRLLEVVDGADVVMHLAANADVRFGWDDPMRDAEQNFRATHAVLEAVRRTGVARLFFTST